MKPISLPDVLNLIMEQRGWSQNRLAREMSIPDDPVTQGWISNVSRGLRDPGIGRVTDYLKRVGWEVRITPVCEDRPPVDRREFIATAASAAFVPSPKVGPYQDPQYVRALAERLDQTANDLGGVPLVQSAMRHVNGVRAAFNGRDRELQAAAADLARKASLILYDARQFVGAERVGNLGLDLARKAGHTENAAHSLENLCVFTTHRDPLKAATYAQRGLNIPELTSEHRARLAVRLAAALAISGRGRERPARKALDEARSSIDRLPAISAAVILGSGGIALGRLKRHDEADQSLAEAVRLFQGTPALRALYLAQQAKAALHGSDPARAAQPMRSLVRVAPFVESSRLDQHITDILKASEPWADSRDLRDVREHLRTVARPTTPRLFRGLS